jgi:uncharacterized protein YecE (DUF72 family)
MDELKYLALIAAAGLLLIATSSQAQVSTKMPHPRDQVNAYEDQFLTTLAERIQSHNNTWVIFDNTALSFAYANARRFQKLVAECG